LSGVVYLFDAGTKLIITTQIFRIYQVVLARGYFKSRTSIIYKTDEETIKTTKKKTDLNDAVCGNLKKESIPGLINL